MSRKSAVIIAIISSLMAVASPAVAGQTISDRSYWPGDCRERIAAEGHAGRAVVFIRLRHSWAAGGGSHTRQRR